MYLQLALPDHPLEFLMSDSNHEDTFNSLEQLRDNLVKEILQHIHSMAEKPTHISFIGHSLGCVLVRAALSSSQLAHLYPLLHTFLSFCGPHLGTLYSTSGLVSAGMWALQKLKKSLSLLQLRLRDHPDPRDTFMYALSSAEGLDFFRHILLVGSPQDHYVPHHSSRIELCKAAVQDPSELGTVYMEMVANLLQRLIKSPRIRSIVRYDVHYETQASANHFIGRAAHIAVLDSDVFMEKFFCVSAAKFFRVDLDDDDNCNGGSKRKGHAAFSNSSVKVVREERSSSTPSSIISDVSLLASGTRGDYQLKLKAKQKIQSSTDPVEKLRLNCLARGGSGILGLGRQFRIIDDNGDKKLDMREFTKGCQDFGIDLTKEEIREVFEYLDKDGSGHIDFDEFLEALRPPMPKCRLELINQAFNKMDRTRDGYITAEDLKGVYNCKFHPKYKNGEWTEEQVFNEFLKKFEAPNEIDGKVTKSEFLNYYAGFKDRNNAGLTTAFVPEDCQVVRNGVRQRIGEDDG
ncbi:hypothetical protein ACTXT7_006343 [Hymenolepis weldensis]